MCSSMQVFCAFTGIAYLGRGTSDPFRKRRRGSDHKAWRRPDRRGADRRWPPRAASTATRLAALPVDVDVCWANLTAVLVSVMDDLCHLA
jgi:hypothetical protein